MKFSSPAATTFEGGLHGACSPSSVHTVVLPIVSPVLPNGLCHFNLAVY